MVTVSLLCVWTLHNSRIFSFIFLTTQQAARVDSLVGVWWWAPVRFGVRKGIYSGANFLDSCCFPDLIWFLRDNLDSSLDYLFRRSSGEHVGSLRSLGGDWYSRVVNDGFEPASWTTWWKQVGTLTTQPLPPRRPQRTGLKPASSRTPRPHVDHSAALCFFFWHHPLCIFVQHQSCILLWPLILNFFVFSKQIFSVIVKHVLFTAI